MDQADLPCRSGTPWSRTASGSNGIQPGNGEQAVVFTEYADTADWLVGQARDRGFTARRYSGRDPHPVRDDVRDAFAAATSRSSFPPTPATKASTSRPRTSS